MNGENTSLRWDSRGDVRRSENSGASNGEWIGGALQHTKVFETQENCISRNTGILRREECRRKDVLRPVEQSSRKSVVLSDG